MSKVLKWIRKSKGSDDDIGLEDQRDLVGELAAELGGEVDSIDLGVQTGFSSMTREGDDLLDLRDDVRDVVERIRVGEYDYLVALDDNRVCRDEYFSVIEYAMTQGGCEFVYVEDVAEDDLTHDIKRRIERDTKEDEIRKSIRAIRRKQQNGEPLGQAPFGLQHNAAKTDYKKDPDEWATLQDVFELLDSPAYTYREIEAETGVSKSGVGKIRDRGEEFYLQYGEL